MMQNDRVSFKPVKSGVCTGYSSNDRVHSKRLPYQKGNVIFWRYHFNFLKRSNFLFELIQHQDMIGEEQKCPLTIQYQQRIIGYLVYILRMKDLSFNHFLHLA